MSHLRLVPRDPLRVRPSFIKSQPALELPDDRRRTWLTLALLVVATAGGVALVLAISKIWK